MPGVTPATRNLKKLLGNPKVTFVLGKSHAFFETNFCCRRSRLRKRNSVRKARGRVQVPTHLHRRPHERRDQKGKFHFYFLTRLLLQGTPEGERCKGLIAKGELVPDELMINILVNAMIANPSDVSIGAFQI